MKTQKKLIDLFEEFTVLNKDAMNNVSGGLKRKGDTLKTTPTEFDTTSGGCDSDSTTSTVQDPDPAA